MNQYDEILEQLFEKLTLPEREWFAQCKVLHKLTVELFNCPWWRILRQRRLVRQVTQQATHCEQLYAQLMASRLHAHR